MSDLDRQDHALKLALALLHQTGSLSLAEIEALPIVWSRDEALQIADLLVRQFGAQEATRRVVEGGGSGWESIISIPSRPRAAASAGRGN